MLGLMFVVFYNINLNPRVVIINIYFTVDGFVCSLFTEGRVNLDVVIEFTE